MSHPVHPGPESLQPFFNGIDALCQPQIIFGGSIAALIGGLVFRRYLVKPAVAIGITVATLAFVGLSCLNGQFLSQAQKPDNVPIWILLAMTGFVLWVSFYQAVRNDDRIRQGLRTEEHEAAEEKLHVWPYLLYIEGIVAAFAMLVLFVWSVGIEAPLEQFANIAKTPNPSKAPWYFLGLQEMLVYYDPWMAGVVLPSMIISGLVVIPYCDPNPKGVGYYTFEQRKLAITTFLFGFVALWVVMIFVGTFLRGPNWNFYGLYEEWNPHKLEQLNNVNLSEFFWQNFMGESLPKQWFAREWPGFAVILIYFTAVPMVCAGLFRKLYKSLGFVRYNILIVHALFMMALPIKMLLRWSFNLKYIVYIPEYFFNI
ncbi:MAG: hypothetical protein L6R28_24430 [Planctomycetes bacterium]|nr:hypothetical protein [Planctomycetota bacterium]